MQSTCIRPCELVDTIPKVKSDVWMFDMNVQQWQQALVEI